MEDECKHDYEVLDKIKKVYELGSDGRNSSRSEYEEKSILKCSKCGDIRIITF